MVHIRFCFFLFVSVREHVLFNHGGKRLEPRFIRFGKAAEERTVDIEHTDDLAFSVQRDHDLGIGRAVAGDMPREGVYVGHKLGFILRGRCAAHAAAEWDLDAGDAPLERAEPTPATRLSASAQSVL